MADMTDVKAFIPVVQASKPKKSAMNTMAVPTLHLLIY